MRKIIKTFVCIIFLSTIGAESAFSEINKIAVVDFKRLWTNLSAVKNLKQDLEETLKKYHQEFSSIESSLRQENEDLRSLANSPSKEKSDLSKLEKRRDLFEKKVFEIQKKAEKRQKSVNKAHGEAINKIKEIIGHVIQAMAKDQKIDLVIYKKNILHHNDSLDITTLVTKEVESKTKNIRLKTENTHGG